MISSPAIEALDRMWECYGARGRWVFTTKGLKNGDLYMALTSFPAFKALHARHTPIDLLCLSEPHSNIAVLFEPVFDTIRVVPDLASVTMQDIHHWCMTRQLDRFAPGNLIYLHPAHMTHGQFDICFMIDEIGFGFIDCMRTMLRVPARTAPALPVVTDAQRQRAAALAEEAGVVPGNSIILFPRAESYFQNAFGHLAKFAAQAARSGMCVLTSVAGGEEAIEGTSPVSIPFDLLLPFAELAGNVVVIRSGIGDIVASAACRKLIVYPHDRLLQTGSVIDMGIGMSAVEAVFPMHERSEDEFVELASRVFLPGGTTTRANEIPVFVAEFLAQQHTDYDGSIAAIDIDIDDGAASFRLRRFRGLRGVVLADGWAGLGAGGVWSDGPRAVLYVNNPFSQRPGCGDGAGSGVISLKVVAGIAPQNQTLGVRVHVGGACAAFILGRPAPERRLEVPIPDEVAGDKVLRLVIDIDAADAVAVQPEDAPPDQSGSGLRLQSVCVVRRKGKSD